ncbi:hypothetical protein [Lacticaseibacillus hulanensis]|jgi:hypothetical protein|uniref:hypothetical protein n=1 Tax=Lacticaseibacillus hulanensis TaxID=2493111 RepID=UPI000FDB7C8C|nr:hypothetical protein [Lacticaseibacillus hulanensis]
MLRKKSFWVRLAILALVVFAADYYGDIGLPLEFDAGVLQDSLVNTAIFIVAVAFISPVVMHFLGPIAKKAFSQKEPKKQG